MRRFAFKKSKVFCFHGVQNPYYKVERSKLCQVGRALLTFLYNGIASNFELIVEFQSLQIQYMSNLGY